MSDSGNGWWRYWLEAMKNISIGLLTHWVMSMNSIEGNGSLWMSTYSIEGNGCLRILLKAMDDGGDGI